MLVFLHICMKHSQIKFYKKSLGKFIFSQATNKNLKMFYFTHPPGQVLKKVTPLFLFFYISFYISRYFPQIYRTSFYILQLHSKFVTSFFPDNALPGEKLLSQIFLF